MAVYRSKTAVYAVILESTFNGGGVFADTDVIEVTSDTSLKPEVDSIERKGVCASFVPKAKVAGKEYGSGTLGVELIPDPTGNGLVGGDVLRVALGIEEAPGADAGAFIGYSDAGVTPANAIYEAQSGETGTAYLYKLSKPCGTQESLAIKEMLGCETTDSQSLVFTGVIPNNVQIDIPVADVCTITFDVGASAFQTSSGETPLVSTCSTAIPYVGKNAKFTVSDTTYEAKDLSLTIENTVSDREAITSSGITEKVVTSKIVKGSFKITFENWDELDRLKANAEAQVYVELTAAGNKFAIYMPFVMWSSVGVEDDDGVLVNAIEFEAAVDSTIDEAILIAHENV
jgi:hypothetical protein